MNVLAGSKPMAMMSLALLLQYPWTSSMVLFSEKRYFSSSVIMMMSYRQVSILQPAE
jgi:hypothetical protein